MDDTQPRAKASAALTSIPDGHKLTSHRSRDELNTAVARLTDGGVPAQALFIVGNNIRQVEVIAGKITYAKAALSGAISGATFGALISVVMALVTNTSILANALTAVPLGIAFWMLTGVLSVARMKNKDAFATRATTVAESYDLMVVPQYSQQARQILGVRGFGATPTGFVPPVGTPQHSHPHPQQGQQSTPPPYPQWQQPVPPQQPPAAPFEPGQYRQPEQNPQVPVNPGQSQERGSVAAPAAQPEQTTQPNAGEPAPFAPPTATNGESKYGLRITDPAEYEAMVRNAPEKPETNPVVEAVRNEPPVQKYGKRITDPAEYEATIRKPDEDNQQR
ncbi:MULTISPECIES: general stress protein [unclassified Rothia (in: high G+C Gram-positive bacteria)]|uniref:general stress protein n=1 Tax=unclassified Rothia (in: high G+C Gram-positive bacteria) TaxID=2689056 RepID=UPI00195F2396|nr:MULTISPECIES: general stress protein [unclassified Rothia (in: high G+C Gram-positive bacteria)]MBM7051093.1 hypothetical protein [Rothia sp. ZJ1223]QRZ62205.1 hypothetical protein JR346_03575 [Rothia sp. ZJ932]